MFLFTFRTIHPALPSTKQNSSGQTKNSASCPSEPVDRRLKEKSTVKNFIFKIKFKVYLRKKI